MIELFPVITKMNSIFYKAVELNNTNIANEDELRCYVTSMVLAGRHIAYNTELTLSEHENFVEYEGTLLVRKDMYDAILNDLLKEREKTHNILKENLVTHLQSEFVICVIDGKYGDVDLNSIKNHISDTNYIAYAKLVSYDGLQLHFEVNSYFHVLSIFTEDCVEDDADNNNIVMALRNDVENLKDVNDCKIINSPYQVDCYGFYRCFVVKKDHWNNFSVVSCNDECALCEDT